MKAFSLLWFPLGLGTLSGPLAAQPVQVVVKTVAANTSFISLDTDIQSARAPLWTLLTDYNHQAHFLPYMSESAVVGHEGADLLVDQAGTLRILFWSFTMRMKQRVTEDPPNHLHFRTIAGDFKRLEGDFRLSPGPASLTHLSCQLTVEPRRRVPDWAVRMAARHYLKKMVQALAEKAERENSW